MAWPVGLAPCFRVRNHHHRERRGCCRARRERSTAMHTRRSWPYALKVLAESRASTGCRRKSPCRRHDRAQPRPRRPPARAGMPRAQAVRQCWLRHRHPPPSTAAWYRAAGRDRPQLLALTQGAERRQRPQPCGRRAHPRGRSRQCLGGARPRSKIWPPESRSHPSGRRCCRSDAH